MDGHILIVDAEPLLRDQLAEALHQDGYRVEVASSRAEALAFEAMFDVVVADIAFDLVQAMKARCPATEVVILSGEAAVDDALAAVRHGGAFDLVVRPFFIEDVSLTVACATARRQRLLDCPLAFVHKNCDMR